MDENQAVQEVGISAAGLNKGVLLAGGVIVGVSVGYYVAKRRLEAKYAKMAKEEIDEVRYLYMSKIRESASTRLVDDIIESKSYASALSPLTMRSEMVDMNHDHQDDDFQKAAEAELAEEPEIISNVFQPPDEDHWEWGHEKHMREAGADPYVLHRDEWLSEASNYVRTWLTYFEGDDVLADDQDNPVDDQDMMVGLANLARFGHGSGDPNVVYVRNVELQMEIEIIHSDGKFSEQRRGIVEPQTDPTDPRKRRNRGPH